MTFTLVDVLLMAIVVMMGGALVVFGRLAFQLNRTAMEVERVARNVADVTPRIGNVLDQAEADLAQVRELTHNTARIAGDLQAVTHEASNLSVAAVPLKKGQVSSQARAVMAGARTGYEAFRRARHNGQSESVPSEN